jgi:anti-anti-sigma factor
VSARGNRRISVEGELTIITAAEQRGRLQAGLNGAAGLDVNLSGVTDMDTAGLQLLLLIRREADRRGVPVEFHHLSPAVADVLSLVRLNQALDRDDPAAGAGEPGAEAASAVEAEPAAAAGPSGDGPVDGTADSQPVSAPPAPASDAPNGPDASDAPAGPDAPDASEASDAPSGPDAANEPNGPDASDGPDASAYLPENPDPAVTADTPADPPTEPAPEQAAPEDQPRPAARKRRR